MDDLRVRVARALEDLLEGGLTATSQATLQVLEATFQETARLGHLRLGLALRGTLEELRRYCQQSPQFSQRRLQALQVRAWLLARRAETAQDSPDPVALQAVGLGVQLRVVAGGFVAADWRLRQLPEGAGLTWSCLSPQKAMADVPLEAYLAIPLKQGFSPSIFLQRRVVNLESVTLGNGRLSLRPQSKARLGQPFQDWERLPWPDPHREWQAYRPGPLDNENEPQLEVLRDGVFGLLHFQRFQQVFQPLSRLGPEGPEFLNLDCSKVDPKLALKTMVFGKDKSR